MAKTMPKPYRLADLAIRELNRLILKRAEKAKNRLSVLKFDEVNVFQETDSLYAGILKDCKRIYKRLYIERYTEVWLWLKNRKPDEDEIDDLVDLYLEGLWNEPNENTHYAFTAELVRKRDRAKEAILSVPTRAQKQIMLDKAVRYVAQQIGFYTDFVSQDAEFQALKDAGVRRVRWNIYGDDRVCNACESLDGQVFDIDSVPDRPHVRCRCYLTPA